MTPIRIEFARAETHRVAFENHFDSPAIFDCKVDRIVFETTSLKLPFKTSNPNLLAMPLPGLEAALDSQSGHHAAPPFVDQVRSIVRIQMQGQRSMVDAVAVALAVSSRSLQGKLGEGGASFNARFTKYRDLDHER